MHSLVTVHSALVQDEERVGHSALEVMDVKGEGMAYKVTGTLHVVQSGIVVDAIAEMM